MKAIPPEHEQKVFELAQGPQGCAHKKGVDAALAYLKEHGVECSHMAVRRLVDRMRNKGAPPPPPKRTPLIDTEPQARPVQAGDGPERIPMGKEPPPTYYPTETESLQHWRRRMHLEAQRAEVLIEEGHKDASWSRFHSAVRTFTGIDAALDRKRQMDLDQGPGQALTPAEEAAAIEAARQHLSASYGLVAPEDLPPPPRADQAPN